MEYTETNRDRKQAAARKRMRVNGRGLLTILIKYEAKPPKKHKRKSR